MRSIFLTPLLFATLSITRLQAETEVLPDELTLKVTVTLHDAGIKPFATKEERTLVLKRYTMRSENFTFSHWVDGKTVPMEAPPVRTYRGFTKENPNELVSAVIYPNGTLDANATAGFLWVWRTGEVQNVADQIRGKPGTNDGRHLRPGAAFPKRDPAPGPWEELPPGGSLQRMRVFADITTECINQTRTGGGWEAAVAWTEWQAMIGDINYTRSIGKSLELVGSLVRMTEYYPSTRTPDVASFLEAVQKAWAKLKETWEEEYQKGDFDFVHASTEHAAGGWTAGPYFYGTFTHELGHCFALEHEIYGVDMQNPVAYGRALLNIKKNGWDKNRFQDIEPNPTAMPVHPASNPDIILTTPDKPVRMKVLSNDFDANGSPLKITFFTEKTVRGGSVRRIEHVEKSGLKLDDLGYIPPRGFVGKDAVIYTVENGHGLHHSEIVHIHVIDDKASLAASWTFDRIDDGFSEDATKPARHAKIPAKATLVPGVNKSGVELISNSRILLGDAAILPDRPKDFSPRNAGIRGSWVPLEEEIGNDFDPLDQSYTLAFWFRRDGGSGTPADGTPPNTPAPIPGILVDKGATADPSAVGYRILALDGKLTLQIREFNAYGTLLQTTHQEPFTPGEWHHVAFVIDRSGTNEARLYLDGKPASEPIPLTKGSFVFSGRADLQLCATPDGTTAFDDTFLAYRPLSLNEIKKLIDRASKLESRATDIGSP